MSTSPFHPLSGVAGEACLRIEEVCTRFEAALRAGEKVRVEDVLGGPLPEGLAGDSPAGAVLLGELLKLELAYRRQGGEGPSPEEYQSRFPGHAELVRALFVPDGSPPAETVNDAP